MEEIAEMIGGRDALNLALRGKEVWNEWADTHKGWGVSFREVNFEKAPAVDISFAGFVFPGSAMFDSAQIGVEQSFVGAHFLGQATFQGVRFVAPAHFDQATFSGEALFDGTRFAGDAEFEHANFECVASFDDVSLTEGASFYEATFSKHFRFSRCRSNDNVTFSNVQFLLGASFSETVFGGSVSFEAASFEGLANFKSVDFRLGGFFSSTVFANKVDFEGTLFGDDVDFSHGTYTGSADFGNVTFSKRVVFDEAEFFERVAFDHAEFNGETSFLLTGFASDADFSMAMFNERVFFCDASFCRVATFETCSFSSSLQLDGTRFLRVPNFLSTKMNHHVSMDSVIVNFVGRSIFMGWETSADNLDASKYRRLKEMAILAQDHYQEQSFFAMEQKAMRGTRYKGVAMVPGLFYETLSDFGRSLLRPVLGLLTVWIGFACLHYSASLDLQCRLYWWNCVPEAFSAMTASLLYSGSQILPFISSTGDAKLWAVTEVYGHQEYVPGVIHSLNVLEGLMAFVFLFLIGLALRNRFRI